MDVGNAEVPIGEDEWNKLMARAQGGDAASYRCLLLAVTPYLRAMAARHHRERSDVEDSVQEILLTVHKVRHTYDPNRPFKPWLVAIARRRIVDGQRRQGRLRARETRLTPEHDILAASQSNLHEAESDARMLRNAVAQLPRSQRRAVTMLKIEEKSLKQAAAATGMSMVALKVSTHRALKNLRKLLDRKG